MRYIFPLDPNCPKVAKFEDALFGDPMSEGAPTDDIMEGFTRSHRQKCKRCQLYGADNVDIDY